MYTLTTQLAGSLHGGMKDTCRKVRPCIRAAREQAIIGYVYGKRG